MPDYYDNVDNEGEFSHRENAPYSYNAAGLNKGQKTALVLLAFFTLAIIGMWGFQFQRAINAPFEYQAPEPSNPAGVCADGNCEASDDDLRSQDTDGDGLSDYDELNVYKTSPYLEDSDSDGYSDKNEIDSGNDPNCPQGQDCYGGGLEAPAQTQAPSSDLALPPATVPQNSQDPQISELLSPDMDAATLRALLIEAGGVDPSILEQVSDEQLMRTYQETLSSQ